MCAEASGPKHSTGVPGLCVSGVSMPIKRTCSSVPPTCTTIVSPSMTRTTLARPSGSEAAPVCTTAQQQQGENNNREPSAHEDPPLDVWGRKTVQRRSTSVP